MPDPTPAPLQGYLNWQELTKALLAGFGQGSLVGLLTYVVVVLGESAHLWYTGPGAAMVVSILTIVASYLRTKAISRKFIDQGQPVK